MAPVTPVDRTTTELHERVVTNIKVMQVRRRISGRSLCERLGQSHNWLSKRNNGVQPFTLDDLVAIARELETTVGELLGIQSTPLANAAAQYLDEFLEDGGVSRSVKDEVLGALGNILRLAYQQRPRGVARVPQGRR